jgi:hypothetical protein
LRSDSTSVSEIDKNLLGTIAAFLKNSPEEFNPWHGRFCQLFIQRPTFTIDLRGLMGMERKVERPDPRALDGTVA